MAETIGALWLADSGARYGYRDMLCVVAVHPGAGTGNLSFNVPRNRSRKDKRLSNSVGSCVG